MARHPLPVLYVDDEPGNVELFKMQFEERFSVRVAGGAEEAMGILSKEDVGVLLTDEHMPGASGIDLLALAHVRWPDTRRVIVSAYSDSPRLLRAINHGHAHEYLVKPWDKKDLAACIERSLEITDRRRALVAQAGLADTLSRDALAHYDTAHIIGGDSGLQQVLSVARRAAQTEATVLLTGETGTGKELLARFIHAASARARAPFVRVNCVGEEGLEGELFGHELSSFTAGQRRRVGRFELAHGGTIFLDEIGNLSPRIQAGLLRALEAKEIEPVGGAETVPVDVRVVAATSHDPAQLVRQGRLREDLYYRLNVILIQVPPLRERAQDIPAFLEHFVRKLGQPLGRTPAISESALACLCAYAWPGNVPELEAAVQRALVLSEGEVLTAEDFSFNIDVPAVASIREQAQQERAETLRQALLKNGGNITKTAKQLELKRTTLLSQLKKYGLVS